MMSSSTINASPDVAAPVSLATPKMSLGPFVTYVKGGSGDMVRFQTENMYTEVPSLRVSDRDEAELKPLIQYIGSVRCACNDGSCQLRGSVTAPSTDPQNTRSSCGRSAPCSTPA